MTDDVEKDPQDQQTVGPTVPKEPGEIGWPADAAKPTDPSVPAKGAGAAHGAYDPGPGTPPNDEPVTDDLLPRRAKRK